MKMDCNFLKRAIGIRWALLFSFCWLPLLSSAEFVRGEINGWGTSDFMTQDTAFGNIWKATIESTSTDTSSAFKFDQDGDWDPQWGSGSTSTPATPNATVGQVRASLSGESIGDMFFNQQSGKHYTFNLNGTAGWWDRQFTIMETSAEPITISSVTNDAATSFTNDVTVTITLSGSKSSEERIFVRWSTSMNFTTSSYVEATGSNTTYSATIPGQASGSTVYFYVLNTTVSSTSSLEMNPDLWTINGNNNGGANYSYLVGTAPLGNSWHLPANMEPTSVTMRNPLSPANTVATFFYNGTYSVESDQSAGTLYYRLAPAGTWTNASMIFDSQEGDNKYWVASIPAGTFNAGDVVEYYFEINYTANSDTFLGSTNNTASTAYELEADAQNNPFSFTYTADLGNAWHVPANNEPAGTTMRAPVSDAFAGSDVFIYNGNQDSGTGNTGDQSGGTVYHRLVGGGSWSTVTMSFDSHAGNNKYWVGAIPADTYSAGDAVEYFLLVTYTDHDDTYIATTNAGAGSITYATLSEAASNAFTFTYSADTEITPAFLFHAGNRVETGVDSVDMWVKIGFQFTNGTRSADFGAIYYTTNGSSNVQGSYGVAGNADTLVAPITFSHTEQDPNPEAEAMWWVGSVSGLPVGQDVYYKIGAWKSTNSTERFADYNSGGEQTFVFRLGTVSGVPSLTVNGQNAEYSTSKGWLDERAGDLYTVSATFDLSSIAGLDTSSVEIFTNLGRRDYGDHDWDTNGIPDGIKWPDFNLITVANAETGLNGASDPSYFRPYSMTHTGGNVFTWSTNVTQCGAYRVSARYRLTTDGPNDWRWYLQYDDTGTEIFAEAQQLARAHAVVLSPKKALEMTLYEINPLNVEATDNTEAGRSTFIDLLSAAEGDNDGFDPFNLDHLNKIQANCLWFQPIHPNGEDSRTLAEGYFPGSLYATKDYWAVSKFLGDQKTEADAMSEFQTFVDACDAYSGSVGSIHIMLDFVANHVSWDAVYGQGGADLFGKNPDDRIQANWFSKNGDYCVPASYYNDEYDNDIANSPDRGDFGKWDDVAELFFGQYASLVCQNPADNSNYLNEGDYVNFLAMDTYTEVPKAWQWVAYYPEYWIKQSGHPGNNDNPASDHLGVDAFRCDFGQGLPPQLWEYIINRTRNVKWDTVFMAETLDGGKPGYRSNRHFDILNENIVFQFTQTKVNNSWDIYNALDARETAYNGGTILLNMTGHDETLPDSDAWLNCTRYGALSTVDGLPMIYQGMERAIQNYNPDPAFYFYDGFLTEHELNFGKRIPHFKQWNKLLVWEFPPPNYEGMDTFYGQVNWARLNSPALQSQNRWFLRKVGGGDEARIFAVAKYEEPYLGPAQTDVVLAFALLFEHGAAHPPAQSASYDLRGAGDELWNRLGLDVDATYEARNIASSDASALMPGWPLSGQELYDNGIFVSLDGDSDGNITNDHSLVQYLQLTAVTNLDVSVEKTASTNQVAVGENITFTIGVSNAGPAIATALTVLDVLPAGFTLVSQSGGYDGTTWTVGTLGIGVATSLTITATADVSGMWTNQAVIFEVGQLDTNIMNDAASVSVLITDDANQAPSITPVPQSQEVMVSGSATSVLQVVDLDGDTVVITATNLPVGASLVDQTNLVWSMVPSSALGTTNIITVCADDQQGQTNSVVCTNVLFIVPVDGDMNGFDDAWEMDNFGAVGVVSTNDPDGDGCDNWCEYVAGTDPNDNTSLIIITNIVRTGVADIVVPVKAGRTYTIEYADDFHQNPTNITWNLFQSNGVFVAGSDGDHAFQDDFSPGTSGSMPSDDTRVYRVRVESDVP